MANILPLKGKAAHDAAGSVSATPTALQEFETGDFVPVAAGGTGLASYTIGDILYASAAATIAKLAGVATGNAVISGGVGVAPSFGKIDLAAHVSGTLPVANGGTNVASYAIGDLLYASAATTIAKLADVAVGSYMRSGGVATAPLWSTLVLPNAATVGDIMFASATNTVTSLAAVAVGSYLRSNGVGAAPVYSTLILPNAATVGDLMIASVTNTYTSLADVATGNVLLSGGVGVVPSYGKVGLTTHISGTLPVANGGTNRATGAYVDEGSFTDFRVAQTGVTVNISLMSSTTTGMSTTALLTAQNILITTTATTGTWSLTVPVTAGRTAGQYITHIIAATGGSIVLTLPSIFRVKTAGTVTIASGATCIMCSYWDGTNFYTFYELTMVAP